MMKQTAFLIIGAALYACAQTSITIPTATARLSPDSLTVGDRATLSLQLVVPHGMRAELAQEPPPLGLFSPLAAQQSRRDSPAFDSLIWTCTVTSFDPAADSIPPIAFLVHTTDSTVDTLSTETVRVRFASVIPRTLPADSITLRDIRGPIPAGKYPWYLWLLIPLALLVAFGLWYWITHRPKKAAAAVVTPPLPPDVEALAALDALDAEGFLTTGRTREYVFALSDIAKRYLSRRYDTNADDRTTDELVDWIRASSMPSAATSAADSFFTDSHPVKFAKMIPDAAAAKMMREKIVVIIEQTKIILPISLTDQAGGNP